MINEFTSFVWAITFILTLFKQGGYPASVAEQTYVLASLLYMHHDRIGDRCWEMFKSWKVMLLSNCCMNEWWSSVKKWLMRLMQYNIQLRMFYPSVLRLALITESTLWDMFSNYYFSSFDPLLWGNIQFVALYMKMSNIKRLKWHLFHSVLTSILL